MPVPKGWTAKRVELRGIGIVSAFRVFFGMTLVLSVLFLSVSKLFGFQILSWIGQNALRLQEVMIQLRSSLPAFLDNPIMTSFLSALVYALFVGIWITLSLAIFSFFSALLGGVQLKLRERSTPPKKQFL